MSGGHILTNRNTRERIMGDKGGKKDKEKMQKQKDAKQTQKDKAKQEKQTKKV